MKNTKLIPILALGFLFLTGCSDLPPSDQIDYDEDVKPLIETSQTPKVRGSCDFIEEQGICIDFIGEIFTEERMKLSCADGKFSLNSCPYSDLGGCMATPGTVSESIAWSYPPITTEEAGYEAKACNSLQAGKWVTPEGLLNR